MTANFTPTMSSITDMKPFRFWCQKVLPTVYDDSLSYYELLNKVVIYLNETVDNVDLLNDNVTNIYNAYVLLQDYVNNYFDQELPQLVEDKLDEMAEDGTLTALISGYIDPLFEAKTDEIDDIIEQQNTTISNAISEQNSTINEAITEQNSTINSAITQQDRDISVLETRMSNFINNHAGLVGEETIWEGDSPLVTENASITLDNPVSDYVFIDIYYNHRGKRAVQRFQTADVLDINGFYIRDAETERAPGGTPQLYPYFRILQYKLVHSTNNGSVLTLAEASESVWDGDTATSATTTTSPATSGITKVVGVNMVQSDSEVTDIRVSVGGTVYPTAGDAVREQITDLNNGIKSITNNVMVLAWSNNHKYIPLNSQSVDINTPTTTSGNVRYVVIPCIEGDIFTVTASGGTSARAYSFIDANGTTKQVADANASFTNEILKAPADSAYLVVNDTSLNGSVIKGIRLASIVENNSSQILKCNDPDENYLKLVTATESETYNGITYLWDGDKCTVSGTSSAISYSDVASMNESFPYGMEAGKTYRVSYDSENVQLRIYIYESGVLNTTAIFNSLKDEYVSIPANASGIKVRLFVPANTVVNETVVPKITSVEVPNRLVFGHRVAMFGDSIMSGRNGDENAGVHTPYTIPKTIEKRLGVVCDNFGVGNMGYVSEGSSMNAYEKISSTDLSPYDTIVMCFGVNDGFNPIGTYDSTDESTCLGQFNKIVNYIFTQKPAVRLIVVAPFNGCNVGTFPKYWYGQTGGGSYSRGVLSNTLKQACEYYNIPYIEQTNSPLNGFTVQKTKLGNDGKSLTYMGKDGVHPSNEGYKAIGGWLAGELSKLIG